MSIDFEILDQQSTPMGDISLRRRREPVLDVDVFEVKLGDEFLMSSLFTAAERALATLALAEADDGPLDVVVGGLGLGYTAAEVLADSRVGSVHVVEALEPVIDWHQRRLVPVASQLVDDRRCRLVHADFFAVVASDEGFSPDAPLRHDLVLLDIDHSPSHHLHPGHRSFYTGDGLGHLARRLQPGGVFAMWSDGEPDEAFEALLASVFTDSRTRRVSFDNPFIDDESTSTVYLATL